MISIINRIKYLKNVIHKDEHVSKIQYKILSLQDFIQSRPLNKLHNLFQQKSQDLFIYGVKPNQFRTQLLYYFKYNYWKSCFHARQKFYIFLQNLKNEANMVNSLSQQQKKDQQQKQKIDLIKRYRQYFCLEIMPNQFNDSYVLDRYYQQLGTYLLQKGLITNYSINIFLTNFTRTLQIQDISIIIKNSDNSWNINWAFNILLNSVVSKIQSFHFRFIQKFIFLAKISHSQNAYFLQFLVNYIQKSKKDLGLLSYIGSFAYLSDSNAFPYEYFYKNKYNILELIEQTEKNSTKKIVSCVYYLEIFARTRLMYCQKIINRILMIIQQNLQSTNKDSLVRIFYNYSKIKYSPKNSFIIKIIERVYIFLKQFQDKHYTLLIKALSNLNYQDNYLIEQLKQQNYQLFLSLLKYNCQHLGQFYQKILDQIQNNFNDSKTNNIIQSQQNK